MKNLIKTIAVLISLVILLSVFTVTAFAESGVLVHGKFNFDYANEVFNYINEYRVKNGLKKLQYDFSLAEPAMIRAAECSVSFSHTRPNGKSWTTAIQWESSAAENIAMGFTNPRESTDGYYGSESHRINMMGDYTRVGVGVFTADNGMTYWIHNFTCGDVKQTYKETGIRTVNVNVALDENKQSTVTYSDGKEAPSSKALEYEIEQSPEIKTVKLSKTSFEYNGKRRAPSVSVKDKDGRIVPKKYYDVLLPKKSTNCGTYKLRVVHKLRKTTFSYSYNIFLKSTHITKIKKTKKKVIVYWKKPTSHSNGIKLCYALNKDFTKKVKTISVNRLKASKLINGLKAKKAYYFKVRAYKKTGGKTYYSSWSKVKKIKK